VALGDSGDDVGQVGEGLDLVQLAGLDGRRDGGRCSAPPSEPAKSAFLRVSAMGRMARSTALESISMRPSSLSLLLPLLLQLRQQPHQRTALQLFKKQKSSGEQATIAVNQAKQRADSETTMDKSDVDACATGSITMEKNHIALDIPEVTMKDQNLHLIFHKLH